MKDYYQILGVNRKASDADIKKAYRKLASQHHPDRGGDANAFKQVQEAYDVLSNPQTRAQFDNPQGFFTRKNNFDDILNEYFHTQRSRSARVDLWIDLKDVVVGGSRLFSLGNHSMHPIEIQIPIGVHDNEAIRYRGLSPSGADLVVNYRVHGHPEWQRDGLDLLTKKNVNFWQLIGGTEITITDLQNHSYKLKVPPGTKPDAMLRLKSKGIKRDGHNTGDILVKINATMPQDVPQEILDLIEKNQLNK